MQALKILVARQPHRRAVAQQVRVAELRASLGEIFQRADGAVHINRRIGLGVSRILARNLVPFVAARCEQVGNFSQQLGALRISQLAQLRTSHIAGVVERRLQVQSFGTCPRQHRTVTRVDKRRAAVGARLPFPAEVALEHLGVGC